MVVNNFLTIVTGTFNVQGCDVSADNTSILVECTFVINSTALSWFVMIQNEQSQYTIGRTLNKLCDKGTVIITGLPAGEYSVRVYDQFEDSIPAYVHSELLTLQSPTGTHSS